MIPLGGGNEIGASAYLYIIGGKNILIDSGIRFNKQDPFPDFDLLKSIAPSLDAILITHAHVDHCGSFHIVSSLYPDTPVYVTHETAQLMPLMVEDAIKVRYIKGNGTESHKEYELLDEALSRIERKDFFDRIIIGDLEVEILPAGHILGAASFLINYGDSESVYHTGDISFDPQSTVLPAVLPKGKVSLLVSESTYFYSNRSFDRDEAIEEFYSTVRKVIGRKGKLLIPVFALGRAQEIMDILTDGMSKGRIPPIVTYVDGLAREVSNIYGNLLRRDFFNYYVQPAPVYEGLSYVEACRENLREADCIVSTSGMLMEGTPSFIYASLISRSSRNAIVFSGYMVEESFGYRLLRDRKAFKSFRCELKKHHFSAHSDKNGIQNLIERVKAKKAVFVHGYPLSGGSHVFNREVVRF